MELKQILGSALGGACIAASLGTAAVGQSESDVAREAVITGLGEVPIAGAGLGLVATLFWTEPDEIEALREELMGYVDFRMAQAARQMMTDEISDVQSHLTSATEFQTGIYRQTGPDGRPQTVQRAPLPDAARQEFLSLSVEADSLMQRLISRLAGESTDELLLAAGSVAAVRLHAMEGHGALEFGAAWPPTGPCIPVANGGASDGIEARACAWYGAMANARSTYMRILGDEVREAIDRRAARVTFTDRHTSLNIRNIGLTDRCAQSIIDSMDGAISMETFQRPEWRDDQMVETWQVSAFGVLDYYDCVYHEVPAVPDLMYAQYPCGDTRCVVENEYRERYYYIIEARSRANTFWQQAFMNELSGAY